MNMAAIIRSLLILFLITTFWHGNLSYAAAISARDVIDVSKYQTQDEFDIALSSYFSEGGKVDDLLAVLREGWTPYEETKNIYSKSDSKFRSFVEHNLFNKYAYEKVIDVGSGNKNIWRILIVENSFLFKRYQTQLIFDDENFAERGIDFQFKYFDDVSDKSDERVERALESLVKDKRTPEAVVEIITKAGASYSGNFRNIRNEITVDGYKYLPDYRVLGKYVTPWHVGMEYIDNRNQRHSEFKIQAQEPRLNIVMP